MGVSAAYVLHGLQTASSFYSQIEQLAPATNIDDLIVTPSGHTQPLFVGSNRIKPEFNLTTHQIETLIGELGILGADLSGGNVDFWLKKTTENATRVADATASHIRMRAAEVFAYIDEISASHDRIATGSARFHCMYDGTNAPLVPAGSTALSGTPTAAENFVVGPVSINSTAIDGVQDVSIAFNPTVSELGSEGEVFDTFAFMEMIQPVITLTVINPDLWATYGLNGTALTNITGYFRKRKNYGENELDASSVHIKYVATRGKIICETEDTGASGPTRTRIRIPLAAADASSNAITFTTSSAIT